MYEEPISDDLVNMVTSVDSIASNVYNRIHKKRIAAVLDASFWSLASAVSLDAYIYEFYDTPLYVPPAVHEEIDSDRLRGPIIGPDRQRYRLAVEDRRIVQYRGTIQPYTEFGAGERQAISLAHILNADLLINDYKPYIAARDLGISVMCVPAFIVQVYLAGMISASMAEGMLDRITPFTARSLRDAAKAKIVQ